MEFKKAKCQTPVLLIFFARPGQFETVFASVKEARPRELFLYQDGPRPNRPDDVEKIKQCRDIAEQIDWDCVVHRKYQTENYGCDPTVVTLRNLLHKSGHSASWISASFWRTMMSPDKLFIRSVLNCLINMKMTTVLI